MSFPKSRIILFILYVFCSTIAHSQNDLSLAGKDLTRDFVTQDTLFKSPYIDKDEWRDEPVRHRYIHGGFAGTETRFSFYFPSKEKYQGRFYQYITPFPDNENLSQGASGSEDKIGFSISSGAYFIETNEGGKMDFSKPGPPSNPTIGAYRANAACAQFSKTVAARYTGSTVFMVIVLEVVAELTARLAELKIPKAFGMALFHMFSALRWLFRMYLPFVCMLCGC
jgi:hypothetical protein